MRFNKTTRIAAAIAVIGAVAAGGAAFTDTTGQSAGQTLGYGSTTVEGGHISGISYQLGTDGNTIRTITLTTTADLSTSGYGGAAATVYLNFNSDPFSATAGNNDATCVVQGSGTTTICTPNANAPANGGVWSVDQVQTVQISITDGDASFS